MSRKQVISCRSRDEMKKTVSRLTGRGFIVKTVERMTPFHPEGLCVREYKVIVWDEPAEENEKDRHGFLKKFFGKTIWK